MASKDDRMPSGNIMTTDVSEEGTSIERWAQYSRSLGSELNRIALLLRYELIEHLHVVFLDTSYRIIASETVSTGDATSAPCDPRAIMRRSAILDARKLILVHNHPVGGAQPSQQDINMTDRIARCALVMGIVVVDHLIVADTKCFSLMRARMASAIPPEPLRMCISDYARVTVRIELRKQFLPSDLRSIMTGTGWVLASILYFEARPVSLGELSSQSAVERSIVVRWIIAMQALELVLVTVSQTGSAIRFIELGDAGTDVMDDLMSMTFGSGPDRVALRSAHYARRA